MDVMSVGLRVGAVPCARPGEYFAVVDVMRPDECCVAVDVMRPPGDISHRLANCGEGTHKGRPYTGPGQCPFMNGCDVRGVVRRGGALCPPW